MIHLSDTQVASKFRFGLSNERDSEIKAIKSSSPATSRIKTRGLIRLDNPNIRRSDYAPYVNFVGLSNVG